MVYNMEQMKTYNQTKIRVCRILVDQKSAVHNEKHIVLYGRGCNGKSHLVNELQYVLETYGYTPYHDGIPDNCSDLGIFCINDMSELDKLGINEYFVLNMDGIHYNCNK